MPNILSQILGRATTPEQIKKVKEFVEEKKLDSNKNLKAALEGAELNLKWATKYVPKIDEFVAQFHNSATTNTISCIVFMSTIIVYMLQ